MIFQGLVLHCIDVKSLHLNLLITDNFFIAETEV